LSESSNRRSGHVYDLADDFSRADDRFPAGDLDRRSAELRLRVGARTVRYILRPQRGFSRFLEPRRPLHESHPQPLISAIPRGCSTDLQTDMFGEAFHTEPEDTIALTSPIWATVSEPGTRWFPGVTIGTDLVALERLNAGPFEPLGLAVGLRGNGGTAPPQ
jgi:hypothetical protein